MSILCRAPTQRSSSYLHTVGFTLSTPFNGRSLSLSPYLSLALSPYLSLSLPFSPLSLPSSFHLYSLHDDTPATLSWQQSGPDCLVARQLTSPIRGTWRYKARDKQIRENMCTCALLCWVSLRLNSHSVISSRRVPCLLRAKATHVGSEVYH